MRTFLPQLAIAILLATPTPQARAATIDASKFPSLQAAIDALPQTGGVVRIPPGEFPLQSPLRIHHTDTRIEGSGAATHLINLNQQGLHAVIAQPANRQTDPRARIWRVQLADLRISGNPTSGDGLHAEGVHEIYAHGLSIDHNGGHGICLVQCEEDPRISDSILTYNAKSGLEIHGAHDIVVNANHFEENLDGLRCIDSFNLCLNGNNIDDHLQHGVVIQNTYGSVLSGNMIEECNATAILLDRDCYGITISANVIAHHLGGGVHLPDAHGCTVSANTFVLVHNHSIVVGHDSARITISANNFCNSEVGDRTLRPADHKDPMGRDAGTGILLEATSDVVVTGNNFNGLDAQAIRTLGHCQRIVVTGNNASDLSRRTPTAPAFDLQHATDSSVEHNSIAP